MPNYSLDVLGSLWKANRQTNYQAAIYIYKKDHGRLVHLEGGNFSDHFLSGIIILLFSKGHISHCCNTHTPTCMCHVWIEVHEVSYL
jgi:hypothetical protein